MSHLRPLSMTRPAIQPVASLVAVLGFAFFVASPVTTRAAENVVAATNNDTTVTTQETYSAIKKTAGVLDTPKN